MSKQLLQRISRLKPQDESNSHFKQLIILNPELIPPEFLAELQECDGRLGLLSTRGLDMMLEFCDTLPEGEVDFLQLRADPEFWRQDPHDPRFEGVKGAVN